jgi:hypothetical protein
MAQDTRTPSAASPSETFVPPSQKAPSDGASAAVRSGLFSANLFSADQYADALMDDLFEGVERVLEGVLPPVEESEAKVGSALAPLSQSGLRTPENRDSETEMANDLWEMPQVQTSSSLAIAPDPHSELTTDLDLEGNLALANSEMEVAAAAETPMSWFDRLLLLAAGVSVVATVVLGFMLERTWRQAQNPPTPALSAAELAAAERRAGFVDYMQKALQAIDQRAQDGQVAAVPGVPPGAIPGSSSDESQAVLERVYIPVYQVPPVTAAIPPGGPAGPSSPPSSPTPPSATTPSAPAASPAAPTGTYTLVGLLELSDRSAVLVNINGITHRFQVGESLGSSGWTLVSVNNQEAVIRRNGEVRSIFVGQNF